MKCNITLDDIFVEITASSTSEARVRHNGTLTGNENAAVSAIIETFRCLSSGKNIDRFFNPTRKFDAEVTIYKCRWERSGKLTVLDENHGSKFQHANNEAEAIQRKRIFTCNSDLYETLPKRRLVTKTPPVQDKSHGTNEASQHDT
jgi:hypothetical protein